MSDKKSKRGPRRGRPRKKGQTHRITVRLREGEDDAILARLAQLPARQTSAYIRRVLRAASEEDLDGALKESAALSADREPAALESSRFLVFTQRRHLPPKSILAGVAARKPGCYSGLGHDQAAELARLRCTSIPAKCRTASAPAVIRAADTAQSSRQ